MSSEWVAEIEREGEVGRELRKRWGSALLVGISNQHVERSNGVLRTIRYSCLSEAFR